MPSAMDATTPTCLGLKVDVCTYHGLERGVPALLRLFNELEVRASFFVACGPDHSGRAIRRLLRPGFLRKMMRTNAVATYGWRTLLYGTLLPGPPIAPSYPDVIRALDGAGHEVAMHGFDHVFWQDRLPRLSATAIRTEIDQASAALTDILGRPPRAFGAPGWQCSPTSLASEDDAGLVYHSDTRGHFPFKPEMGGQRFRTLDIPTTLPTLDETFGRVGTSPESIADAYETLLRQGVNVYTAHAEMEGIRQLPHLRCLLERIKQRLPIRRLIDIAGEVAAAPVARVILGPIEGRAGSVAWQENAHA
jgi:undecaprenyl phosphate-alpha-L-ara4FN deformylase